MQKTLFNRFLKMKKILDLKNFTILYFLIAAIEILADLANIQWLVYCTKPLLMLSLSAFYVFQRQEKLDWQDKTLLVAFMFSMLGDSFLMIKQENLFVFGLGSFLITHLCYIFIFGYKYQANFLARIAFLIYAISIIFFLKPHLPEALFLPVLVYSFTIATMGIRAAERKTNAKSYKFVFLGAILFIISDSLIAIGKFVNPIPADTILVMGTYVFAQYLICVGMLESHLKEV